MSTRLDDAAKDSSSHGKYDTQQAFPPRRCVPALARPHSSRLSILPPSYTCTIPSPPAAKYAATHAPVRATALSADLILHAICSLYSTAGRRLAGQTRRQRCSHTTALPFAIHLNKHKIEPDTLNRSPLRHVHEDTTAPPSSTPQRSLAQALEP